jgi:replicative DNA helicase
MIVEGERPPVFTEREINTDKGLQELAVKRYFSDAAQALNAVSIPFLGMSKEEIAMRMWEEDERLRQMTDFEERATMEEALGEDEQAKETRRLIRDATARSDTATPVYEKNR